MKYVHVSRDATGFVEQTGDVRRRQRSAEARIADATAWTEADMRAFQAEINLKYVSPWTVPVGRGSGSGSDLGDELHLLNVGFSLAVPARCSLTWARFVVQDAATQNSSVRFVSLFPSAVCREVGFAGPFDVDDKGVITRETTELHGMAANEGLASPFAIGFLAAARTACWDFTPLDGRPPIISDQLVISITKPPEHVYLPRQQLFINIFDPGLGEALLELPGTTDA